KRPSTNLPIQSISTFSSNMASSLPRFASLESEPSLITVSALWPKSLAKAEASDLSSASEGETTPQASQKKAAKAKTSVRMNIIPCLYALREAAALYVIFSLPCPLPRYHCSDNYPPPFHGAADKCCGCWRRGQANRDGYGR